VRGVFSCLFFGFCFLSFVSLFEFSVLVLFSDTGQSGNGLFVNSKQSTGRTIRTTSRLQYAHNCFEVGAHVLEIDNQIPLIKVPPDNVCECVLMGSEIGLER